MSEDNPLKKELERLQQGAKLLQNATGFAALPRHSLSELVGAVKPPGVLAFETTAKELATAFQQSQTGTLLGAVAEAARAFQQNRTVLHDVVRSAFGFQTMLAQTVQDAFQPFVNVMRAVEQMQENFRAALEPVQRIREAFTALPIEQFSSFRQSFVGLAESFQLKLAYVVEKPASDLFTKLGFTGLESHLTRSELLYILKLSKEKGKAAVQQYVFRKFRMKKYLLLNRTVRHWWRVPYMNKRKKMIRAAINAHKKRNFELAIPALLPLIDGLAAEIAAHTPNLKTKTMYTKDVAKMHNDDEAEVWSACVEQVVFGLVYKDYDFRTAKRPPSSVNRHGILHGRVVDYGSELNSYRVIFLLDVMVHIADQRSERTNP